MIPYVLNSRIVTPIIISSLHGAYDLHKPPLELLPYMITFVPIKDDILIKTFIFGSIIHFSYDINILTSIVLHAFFVKYREKKNLVLNVFYLYYCYVHVLKFCLIHNINIYIYLCLIILSTILNPIKKIQIENYMLRIILGHIFIDLKNELL
tara:strand:+ start:1091 stop:1546 length:456 start_codon:yes stop_codon:yes gene_type:complete